jgi:hypothetical protein
MHSASCAARLVFVALSRRIFKLSVFVRLDAPFCFNDVFKKRTLRELRFKQKMRDRFVFA